MECLRLDNVEECVARFAVRLCVYPYYPSKSRKGSKA